MRYYLAIDIGASSGRHILGHMESGKLVLEEMYRFENRQIHVNGHDCWDLDSLWQGIVQGLRACATAGKIPCTVGIDTWAVDYVLLDENNKMLGGAVAYRDKRTEGFPELISEIVSPELLYEKTGIQTQNFNTLYQLAAQKREHPEELEKAKWLLMIPEYFHFRLTGVKQNEYTNATSTNLINAREKTWDRALIETLGLPNEIFHELAMPGTILGNFLPEIQKEVGFDAAVLLPATHDTGSAFLAVPAQDENAVYLSCGTWSLLGVEIPEPVTTEESRLKNFTNEGGAWYRFRYLKNIMGLWMIQSVRRELNGTSYVAGKETAAITEKKWSFPDLIAAARADREFCSVIDVNQDCFLAPESMIQAICGECARTGQAVPQTVGELMQCIYLSLALCCRTAIGELEALTGKTYTSVHMVGGGCQDEYLNSQIARITGLPVYAGPIEGTAIGNLIVQMIGGGEFPDLQAARAAVRCSFEIKEVKP